MPIFEYSCDDCGKRFEQLIRRSAEVDSVRCPACGADHLTTEYSTFSAHAHKASSQKADSGCGSGMCGSDFCASGACGMNFN